ncbi:BQ2448_4388 [Microbotryum intermedium]|uniref:BQ2448_4388 protein n=1 Tax=Microbotryum intermedium TaxID=269621 RepID=A0A238FL24_9BASI|nr:BQ2448_4388 [Microbotryum intermedium]
MPTPRAPPPRYHSSTSYEGRDSLAAPSRPNEAGGAEEAGDYWIASPPRTTTTGGITYPPTRDGEYVISFDGSDAQGKDGVWTVSMQSELGGDHVSSSGEDSDNDDDGVNDRSVLYPTKKKGRINKNERRNSRDGPRRIEWRESRTRPEDGWIVGGRRWQGAALAVAGLVVLILLLLLTSMSIMDQQKHNSSVLLGPKDFEHTEDVESSKGSMFIPRNLKQAVGMEPKFLVMDGDDAASFFDLRVIIETVLNLASISRRILVIPGHVEECTRYSLEHREESWRGPEGWKIEIEVILFCLFLVTETSGADSSDGPQHLIDIPHLRKTYGLVLTQSEFSTLLNITSNEWFNDAQFVRLDENLPAWTESESEAMIDGLSTGRAREIQVDDSSRVWSLSRARELLRKNGYKVDGDDHWLEEALRKVEQSRVYSFDERSDRIKTVAQPTIQMADRSRSFSFADDFLSQPRHRDASLLYVSGPIWNEGKLGGVHFSSQQARDRFVVMTQAVIRPPKEYIETGRKIADKMAMVNEGRAWLATEMSSIAAAHTHGCTSRYCVCSEERNCLETNSASYFMSGRSRSAEARILNQRGLLEQGLAQLSAHDIKTLPSKDHLQVVDRFTLSQSYDLTVSILLHRYFLAMDETDAATLATFQRGRAVVLTDLLSEAELKILGWRAMFSDLLQLVEQEVMASSDYFVGTGSSRSSRAVLDARSGPRFGRPAWSWSLDDSA